VPPAVKWTLAVVAVAVLLAGLDRLLLAAEARRYIYYRRRQGSPGTIAGAMMEVHSHLQPSVRHVVEEQRRVVEEEDDQGAPPDPHPTS